MCECVCVCVRKSIQIYTYTYTHTMMLICAAHLRCNPRHYHTGEHCNAPQHTTTHCNTLQHTATHCNTLQHTATPLQHSVTPWYCNTPWNAAYLKCPCHWSRNWLDNSNSLRRHFRRSLAGTCPQHRLRMLRQNLRLWSQRTCLYFGSTSVTEVQRRCRLSTRQLSGCRIGAI